MKCVWTWLLCCLLMEPEAESLSVDKSSFLTSYLMRKVFEEGQNAFTTCRKDLFRMATQANQTWALKMFDATSKPGSGLMMGNRYWSGSHDLCLSAVAPSSNSFLIGQGFRGRYCWITWEVNTEGNEQVSTLPVKSAACVPGSCEQEDIEKFYPFVSPLLGVINPKAKAVTEMVKMKSVSCPKETRSVNTYTMLTLAVLMTIMCLAVLGTLQDIGFLYKRPAKDNIYRSEDQRAKKWNGNGPEGGIIPDILLCFSLKRNAAAILNVEEREPSLSFMHGLRVISICWILFGHGQSHIATVERNFMEHAKDIKRPFEQFFHHGFYAVDTFFFISAFLLGFNLLSNTNFRLTTKSSVFIIINRYIRTAPSMLITFVIYVHVVDPLCRGQFWFLNRETSQCHAIWWTYPLYIQNFYWDLNECLTWLWYLAVDFQLFLVSLPVIVLLKRNRQLGTNLILLFMLSSCVFGFVTVYSHGIKTFYDYTCLIPEDPWGALQQMKEAFTLLHSLPHTRGGAYWVGLLFALFYIKPSTTKAKTNGARCHWTVQALLASLPFLFIILFPALVTRGNLTNALYISTSRVVWAGGLVLLFDLCTKNPKCALTEFLSWRGWRILSKANYSVYLLHVIVLTTVMLSRDRMVTYSNNYLTTVLIGVMTFCFPICFIFSLVFEAPFINLGKLMAKNKL